MEIDLPDTISAETLHQAKQAAVALRALMDEMTLPAGLEAAAVSALIIVVEGVAQAAAEDNTDLNPSEAAERLRMARPSVMRLIARGELSSRKDGGHYVLSPRELRAFQARLGSVRREALCGLAALVDEFGF